MYNKFLEYLESVSKLDKNKYIEIAKIFKDNTNLYFDKYINELDQDEFIKNKDKFEYYLNNYYYYLSVNEKHQDKNISAYYKDISKYPVLDFVEEKNILDEIYKLRNLINKKSINDDYLDNILKYYGYNKTIMKTLESRKIQLKYLKRLNNNDTKIKDFELYVDYVDLKEYFFKCNLRLVTSLLRKKNIKSCDLLDFIEWGNEGLLVAVDRFDPTFNTRFSTYAYYWINCKINLNYYKERRNGKTSYGMNYIVNKFYNYCNKYYNMYGIYPTKEEKILFIYSNIYKKNNSEISKEDYIRCEKKLNSIENIISYENTSSIDTLIGEDKDNSIIDMIEDHRVDVEKEGTAFELKDIIKTLFSNFSIKHCCIIILKNGLGIYNYISFDDFCKVFSNLTFDEQVLIYKSNSIYTLQEIGNLFNVTRQAINVQEKKIMKEMKKYKYLFYGYIE